MQFSGGTEEGGVWCVLCRSGRESGRDGTWKAGVWRGRGGGGFGGVLRVCQESGG